jgi:hypothetical protein
LDDECPHTLAGFRARFAALAALHNACLWINRSLGRDPLAFANLIDWQAGELTPNIPYQPYRM